MNVNLTAVRELVWKSGIDSTSELARITGIERTYMHRILNGERPMSASHVISIAAALSVSPMALLNTSDPKAEIVELAKAAGVTAEDLEQVAS